jgi:heme-degrading monooxygenase HmoA
MYISIARYAGMAGSIGEAAPKVQQGLVPLLKGQPGFHGYATFATDQGDVVALTIWESAEALTKSREKIHSWVADNLTAVGIGIGEPTERFHGEVGQHALASPQSGGQGQSLYCLIRKAENLPAEAMQRAVRDEMLAAAQKAPGFRGVYYIRSGDNPSLGASVLFCDTREHASAVHETTAAIMKKQQPNVAIRVAASGTTAVLAMA